MFLNFWALCMRKNKYCHYLLTAGTTNQRFTYMYIYICTHVYYIIIIMHKMYMYSFETTSFSSSTKTTEKNRKKYTRWTQSCTRDNSYSACRTCYYITWAVAIVYYIIFFHSPCSRYIRVHRENEKICHCACPRLAWPLCIHAATDRMPFVCAAIVL